jgi:hypothetical protein
LLRPCLTTRRRRRSISCTGYWAHVWSKACRRAKDAELAALIAAGHGDVPLVQMKSRCGNCGSRRTEFVVGGSDMRPGIGL